MGAVVGKIAEETPAHVVVRRADGYQVWRYPGSVVAVVRAASLDADNPPRGDEFTNRAFRTLARYIGVFGDAHNRAAGAQGDAPEALAMTAPVIMPAPQKIAMTAPVIMPNSEQVAADGGTDCMMFVLPARIGSVDEAPRPTNDAVSIEQLPAGRCEAVLAFGGAAGMKQYAEKADRLLAMLQRDGVSAVGDWNAQGYNPPFTLPWMRRNEVHVPVDAQPYAHLEGEPKEAD
ncbi:SOUL heme-binding protein [Gracilaria domingensis]|nr:SOUL heme-binding protein [Gracilaria domingensis]